MYAMDRVKTELSKWAAEVKEDKVNRRLTGKGVVGNAEITICFASYSVGSAPSDSWKHYMRGAEFDEIFVINGGIELDYDSKSLLLSRLRDKGNHKVLMNLLYFILRDIDGGSITGVPEGRLFEHVNFPISLYRLGMEESWLDRESPTPEEFLMSVMMEGVHATTDEEKAAIEEAKVYVEGKDNGSDKGQAQ